MTEGLFRLKTIPQSPIGDSSLYTREPSDIACSKCAINQNLKHLVRTHPCLPLRGRGTALAVDEEREGISLFAQIERVVIVSKATSLCKSKNRPPHPPHIRSAPSPLEKANGRRIVRANTPTNQNLKRFVRTKFRLFSPRCALFS